MPTPGRPEQSDVGLVLDEGKSGQVFDLAELHVFTHGDDEHLIRMRRATREARAVARVTHPHVVGVHDLVESEDRLWIVMELVEGPSLAQQISDSGPLTPQHVAVLSVQLLDAL